MPRTTESASRPDDLTGTVIAERYRVEALLGEGGMGAVYRARHVHMHKAVAIKVLHREMTLNEEVRMRFEREAVASARIDHPHVTGATDFGKLEDGTCYLVLDYVSGQSLKKVLKEERLSAGRTLHIVRQIASALDAAHTAGVVHRDLKPENVMLVEHKGEADFVKVLDFGIAKLQSQNSGNTVQLTQAGAVFGTPEYMSPEQAAGNAVDGRADLYTIGILLYEMLSGDTPFHGETIVAILTQHLTVEAPDLADDVPPALRRIVKKLLQKDPERRFQTAAELLEAFDAVEEPQTALTLPAPALTPPPTPLARLGNQATDAWRTRVQPTLLRWSGTPLELRGRSFPFWQLALGCSALGVVLTLLVWPAAQATAPPTPTPSASPSASAPVTLITPPKPPAPAARVDLGRARAGEGVTLAELAAMPAKDRSPAEWGALVVGQFRAGNRKTSLATLDAALEQKQPVALEPDVLATTAALALHDATSETALLRLGQHFGERGADLLYAWSKEPPNPDPSFSQRVEAALESAAEGATPALKVALELDLAKNCSAIRDLLARARSHADDRSTAALQKKTARRGCGLLNFGDCFKCLRGSNDLNDAIEAAKSRPAPDIVVPLEQTPAAPGATR